MSADSVTPASLRHHRRVIAIVLGIGLAVTTLAVSPASSSAEHSPASSVNPKLSWSSIHGYRVNISNLTNQHRRNAGVAALAYSPALTNACQGHANYMAQHRVLSHTGANRSSGGYRARVAGFNWTMWGENLAAGQQSSRQVVAAWMGSSGHRANMLNRRFTHFGVGVQSASNGVIYYCMLLARP
jgi:uncharacterized protein YkwD